MLGPRPDATPDNVEAELLVDTDVNDILEQMVNAPDDAEPKLLIGANNTLEQMLLGSSTSDEVQSELAARTVRGQD